MRREMRAASRCSLHPPGPKVRRPDEWTAHQRCYVQSEQRRRIWWSYHADAHAGSPLLSAPIARRQTFGISNMTADRPAVKPCQTFGILGYDGAITTDSMREV